MIWHLKEFSKIYCLDVSENRVVVCVQVDSVSKGPLVSYRITNLTFAELPTGKLFAPDLLKSRVLLMVAATRPNVIESLTWPKDCVFCSKQSSTHFHSHTHACTHTCMHTHACTHTHTCTHAHTRFTNIRT